MYHTEQANSSGNFGESRWRNSGWKLPYREYDPGADDLVGCGSVTLAEVKRSLESERQKDEPAKSPPVRQPSMFEGGPR